MTLSLTSVDVVHVRRSVAKILAECSEGVNHNPYEIEALCSKVDQWVSVFPAHNTMALKQWGVCYCNKCVADGACDTTWAQVYPIHASDELWPRAGNAVRWIHRNRQANGVHHAIQWSMTRNTSALHLRCARICDLVWNTSSPTASILQQAQLGVLMKQSPAPGARTFYQDDCAIHDTNTIDTYAYARYQETPVVYNLRQTNGTPVRDSVVCSNRIVYSDRYICITQRSWVSRVGYTKSMSRCHDTTRFGVTPHYAVHIRIPYKQLSE